MHSGRQCRFRSPCSAAASCVGSVHSLKELWLRAEMVGNPKLSQIFSHMDKVGNGRCTRAPSVPPIPPSAGHFRPRTADSGNRRYEGGNGRQMAEWAAQRAERGATAEGGNGRYNGGNRRYEGGNARYEAVQRRKSAEMPGRGRKWTVQRHKWAVRGPAPKLASQTLVPRAFVGPLPSRQTKPEILWFGLFSTPFHHTKASTPSHSSKPDPSRPD